MNSCIERCSHTKPHCIGMCDLSSVPCPYKLPVVMAEQCVVLRTRTVRLTRHFLPVCDPRPLFVSVSTLPLFLPASLAPALPLPASPSLFRNPSNPSGDTPSCRSRQHSRFPHTPFPPTRGTAAQAQKECAAPPPRQSRSVAHRSTTAGAPYHAAPPTTWVTPGSTRSSPPPPRSAAATLTTPSPGTLPPPPRAA